MAKKKILIIENLLEQDNFSQLHWEERGLNMSSPEICAYLNADYNRCLTSAYQSLVSGSDQKKMYKKLKVEIMKTDRRKYDTEEREFLMDRISEVSRILGVNSSRALNKWLYGKFFGTILNLMFNR